MKSWKWVVFLGALVGSFSLLSMTLAKSTPQLTQSELPTPTFTVTATPTQTALPTATPTTTPTPTSVIAQPDTYENDDQCAQSAVISSQGATQIHNFHEPGDIDWLRFEVVSGRQYRIEVIPELDSPADVNMQLFSTCQGDPEGSFEETFTPNVRFDLDAQRTGTFYIRLSNFDADVSGNHVSYEVSIDELRTTAASGALILMGGRFRMGDRLQPNIHYVTDDVYKFYKSRGFLDENIFYLATDPSLPGYDAPATLANLQTAITSWAASRVGDGSPLTLYFMDHGEIDIFFVDEPNGQQLSPELLDSWLDQLEAKTNGLHTTIIIEACHSGSFIVGEKRVSQPGRLTISSTNLENVAYASRQGAQFSDRFVGQLRLGSNIYTSFWSAHNAVNRLYRLQEPWIDANGNGIPNEPEDRNAARQHKPGYSGNVPADLWAPWLVWVRGPSAIVDETGEIQAEVRDNNGVKSVTAVFYPPSYVSPTESKELIPEDLDSIQLTSQGGDVYAGTYDKFTEKGTYRVAVYAEDIHGLKARFRLINVMNLASVYLPLLQTDGPDLSSSVYLPLLKADR